MHQAQLSTTHADAKFQIVDLDERTANIVANDVGSDDRSVMDAAVSTSTYQVEAGRLALSRAQSLTVRDLARYMIGDHAYFMRKLEVGTGNLASEMLDTEHQERLQLLRETPVDKFDRVYLEQIRWAHEKAITRLEVEPSILKRIDARLQSVTSELTGLIRRQLEMVAGVQRRSQRLGIKPHYQGDRA